MGRATKRLKLWLGLTGAIYAAGALDFLLHPRGASESLGRFGEPIAPEEPPGVFNALAAAYMATIASLALTTAKSPEDRRALVPPLLVAKGVSSGALLYRYLQTRKAGFAVGSGLDALLFGVTAGLYAASGKEQ